MGNDAGIQGIDALGINIGADDVVPGFSEAGRGHESDIPAANDGKIQVKFSSKWITQRGAWPSPAPISSQMRAVKVSFAARKIHAVRRYEFRLPMSKPRSPRSTSWGWWRMTFQSRRVDSSRLISPSEARVVASSRSTSCE